MKTNARLFIVLSTLLFALNAGPAFCEKAKIAMLSVENGSKDPRYDYLEGLLSGLLLYDLSSVEDITLVERSSLESIMKEQELMMSDIGEAKAFQIGKIAGADYLLKASFVFLGNDIVLSATVMDVATSKSIVFSERGKTENLAHAVAEKIIMKLTGRDVKLVSDLHERSILSLKDEKPGSIWINTPIIDGEVQLDGEFVAYTTGDAKVPVKLDNVAPGKHKVTILLAGFGMFKEPELTFQNWEETVDVQPGKTAVIKARPYTFYDLVYMARKLASDTLKMTLKDGKGSASKTIDASFTDRKGTKIPVTISITGGCDEKTANASIKINYSGKESIFSLACNTGEEKSDNWTIEKVSCSFTLNYRYKAYASIEYRIERNDISDDEIDSIRNK